jgi:hypothetical protein
MAAETKIVEQGDTAIASHWHGEHLSMATNAHATEELLGHS